MSLIENLDSTLELAIKRLINGSKNVGLLFSAGLDSSLLAKMCVDIGLEPVLISVFMKGSSDEAQIKEATSFFGLEHVEKMIFEDEVEDYIQQVSIAASTKNPMDLSIGVGIFCGLETAAWTGLHTVMVGQGADELFGGYHRYLRMEGETLAYTLKHDVENINIARDVTIAKSLDICLITPFLDKNVIEIGLNIPVELKIKNGVRKYILREVARKRGLPESIWAREKKAIQYSTGVDKIVKKVLRKKKILR
jgi:asparagine synthase (glutamine-hydrolysing)